MRASLLESVFRVSIKGSRFADRIAVTKSSGLLITTEVMGLETLSIEVI